MPVDIKPDEMPVLLLYNLDPSWTLNEKDEVTSLALQLANAISSVGHPTTLLPLENEDIHSAIKDYDPESYIIFNWCEGLPGVMHSEWLVAQALESIGFAFTGANSATLSLAQEKHRVKTLLEKSSVPTPRWQVYDNLCIEGWDIFPAIVKPVNEHCSEGITSSAVVSSRKELKNRLNYIFEEYRQMALVEDFIDDREFHVSLWGNGHIEVLPPVEMDFSIFSNVQDRLCTYDSKFVPGSSHYEGIKTLLPAPLNEDEVKSIEDVCRSAYRAIDCRDYGRIDLRVRDGVYYVLDVNPNADISYDASLACSAEFAGYTYGETGSRIVRLAARRHPVWGKYLE